jgi:hypothetical protein
MPKIKDSPVSLQERLVCSKRRAGVIIDKGLRTINQFIAEGRLDTVMIGGCRMVTVESLSRLVEAGKNAPLVEPPQFKRARQARLQTTPARPRDRNTRGAR